MGDIFQRKINELFSGMTNVTDIADDILIAGIDEWGMDHDETLEKILQVCRLANLKLTKDKCLFRCVSMPFWQDNITTKYESRIKQN